MKVTLNIDDALMKRLRQEAVRCGCTMSEVVESALWLFLQKKKSELPALPTFNGGALLVDISNRDALYSVMGDPSSTRAFTDSVISHSKNH